MAFVSSEPAAEPTIGASKVGGFRFRCVGAVTSEKYSFNQRDTKGGVCISGILDDVALYNSDRRDRRVSES